VRFVSARLAWLSIVLILAATVGCKAQSLTNDPLKDPALAARTADEIADRATGSLCSIRHDSP